MVRWSEERPAEGWPGVRGLDIKRETQAAWEAGSAWGALTLLLLYTDAPRRAVTVVTPPAGLILVGNLTRFRAAPKGRSA